MKKGKKGKKKVGITKEEMTPEGVAKSIKGTLELASRMNPADIQAFKEVSLGYVIYGCTSAIEQIDDPMERIREYHKLYCLIAGIESMGAGPETESIKDSL